MMRKIGSPDGFSKIQTKPNSNDTFPREKCCLPSGSPHRATDSVVSVQEALLQAAALKGITVP